VGTEELFQSLAFVYSAVLWGIANFGKVVGSFSPYLNDIDLGFKIFGISISS
jgi:hypothetical protein